MNTKLKILVGLAVIAAVVFILKRPAGMTAAADPAPARVKTLRPEVKTINYISRQPGRPPMPWPPEGVSSEVIDATTCLLNDENYVYPTVKQAAR